LIFGQSRPGGGTVSEAEWNAFLAEFVTPRLPEGFTVLDGYGQWRDRTTGVVTREASRILVVWHVADTTLPQSLDTIRNTYRARFAQESVMAVAGVSCVRF
jgi:hypothetical protein